MSRTWATRARARRRSSNQAIVTATVTAIAEAVGLAQASGIDAARLAEALAGGWADSVLLQTFVPRMTSGGHPPIGALGTFQKDVDAIADAARDTGAVMPVSATVQQVLRLGAAQGSRARISPRSSTSCGRATAAGRHRDGQAERVNDRWAARRRPIEWLANQPSERGVVSPAFWRPSPPRRLAFVPAPNSGRMRARARLANTRKPKPFASYQ